MSFAGAQTGRQGPAVPVLPGATAAARRNPAPAKSPTVRRRRTAGTAARRGPAPAKALNTRGTTDWTGNQSQVKQTIRKTLRDRGIERLRGTTELNDMVTRFFPLVLNIESERAVRQETIALFEAEQKESAARFKAATTSTTTSTCCTPDLCCKILLVIIVIIGLLGYNYSEGNLSQILENIA